MQGTVAAFDADSGTGTVYLDDGTEVTFPTEAFVASGLRHLRLGQRVRLESGEDRQITLVTLPTM